MIGGMTWDSTALYYDLINRVVQKRLGGLHSAKIAMVSLDFATVEELARTSDWDGLAVLLGDAACRLKAAGAELLVICANTPHRVAERVEQASGLPLVHVCDCTAAKIKNDGLKRIVLLGTRYTMREEFFTSRLRAAGLDVFVPEAADREIVQAAIDEVWRGALAPSSRAAVAEVVKRCEGAGAQGIILGCTELPHILTPGDSALPLYDTLVLHAQAAVEAALA